MFSVDVYYAEMNLPVHPIRESRLWVGLKGNSKITGYATGISRKERRSLTSETTKWVVQ